MVKAIRVIVATALLVALVGCTTGGPQRQSAPPSAEGLGWRMFRSTAVPWTLTLPRGWHVTTSRSDPDPRYRVGVLASWVGTERYRRDFRSGPNSGSGASRELGRSAMLLRVSLLWSPADRPIEWDPTSSSLLTVRRASRWYEDAQNPGWTFREHQLCQGNECVSVLEWRGPMASTADTELAGWVAESVELRAEWRDALPASEFRALGGVHTLA